MKPKISVLMGAYNCAETIGSSIESIQAQTVTDWEMIICDDGSSDNTVEIIRQYVSEDARILLIQNEGNRGLSYALNHCLQYAKGEYCARMDGDDLCDADRFEKQLAVFEAHPEYAIVSTSMKHFDEQGVYYVPPQGGIQPVEKKNFLKGSPFCHAPAMIRTEAYRMVDGYRDIEKTRGVEDYDLWFRMYAAGLRGCMLRDPLYSMFDGRDAAKRRTFRRRMNEAWVRKEGYRMLKLPWHSRIYVWKPIVLGLLPTGIYRILHRNKRAK